MAGLLLMAVVAGAMSGCLLPQDDQVIPELPPKKNSPISIVSYTPKMRREYYPAMACAGLNEPFTVTVSDSDRGDFARSLWFVDFNPATAIPGVPATPSPMSTGTALVASPQRFTFTSQLSSLTPEVHTITVFVTDSTLDQTDTGVVAYREPVTLADGGTVADSSSLDSFTWILDVKNCP